MSTTIAHRTTRKNIVRALPPALLIALVAAACGGAGGGEVTTPPPGGTLGDSIVELDSAAPLNANGPAGGPFTPGSATYTLTNTGSESAAWTSVVSAGDDWVKLSAKAGTLAPGQGLPVVVSINQPLAGTLPSGFHAAQVLFLEPSGGELIGSVDINLSVAALLGPILAVTPAVGFASSGTAGGPFGPANAVYELQNTGDANVDWEITSTKPWILFSEDANFLRPDESTSVTVAIDQNLAAGLSPGNHQSTVVFENLTNDVGTTTVQIDLSIAAAPLPGNLSVTPLAGLNASGPAGGPFTGSTANYTLGNFGSEPIAFTVTKGQPWVSLSTNGGTLQPSEVNVVTVSIQQSLAGALSPGAYSDLVNFTNTTNGQGNASIPVDLAVVGVPDPGHLVVTPNSGFAAAGPPNGPFSPATKVYNLANDGDLDVNWSASVNQNWLAISGPKTGQLAPDASTGVTVVIKSVAAASLPEGTHNATITFTDTGTGSIVLQLPASLTVVQGVVAVGGWTEFSASPDTRTIYVSSSQGSDSNDGLSESAPKQTIAAGKAELRHGFPDWLLLKKGDTWNEALGHWKKGGRSESEPMLVSSYGAGTQRPLLRTGNSNGVNTVQAGGSPASLQHVAFVGIHLWAHTYAGTGGAAGLTLLLPCEDFLFEDMVFQNYSTGIVTQGLGGPVQNVRIRRSHIWDSWALQGNGNPQGMYSWNTHGLLLEGNVFDTNGWKPGVPGAHADIFSHNLYIDNECTNVVTVDNIIVAGASHGIQQRCGGEIRQNLFLRNAIAIVGGEGNYPEAGGVDAFITDNVIMDGRDISGSEPRGWGIVVANIKQGEVTGNLIANNVDGNFPLPINIRGDYDAGTGPTIGVINTKFEDNTIYNWGPMHIEGNAGQHLNNLTLKRNEIQDYVNGGKLLNHYYENSIGAFDCADNKLYSALAPTSTWVSIGPFQKSVAQWKADIQDSGSAEQQVSYPAPNKTVGDYNAAQGFGNSHDAFMQQVRLQSKDFWRPQYSAPVINDWFRANFGK